ncbi:hypothetical protein KFE25_005715 [Diacronema lutheri]|uniref:Sulphur transport domain-containing protein n=1 Tax=Diacronema lutheri TaxID=2081491 RepID=A0A8J6C3C5_DIALT|nr:hypothetical protein KFE25_005715 [Diacronema lutheri]
MPASFLSLHVHSFFPAHAAVGGAVMGAAGIAHTALSGQPLGVSGTADGLVRGRGSELHRWLFLLGLFASGVTMAQLYPASISPMELAPWREAVGGFAVGLGSALAHGCTAGHGISGNARFSPRSAFFTLVALVAGCIVATATRSADAVRMQHAPFPKASDALTLAAQLLGAHCAGYVAVVALSRGGVLEGASALSALSPLDGSLFGCGLALAGGTSPARVAQFLDLSRRAWNPTLACAAAGALAVLVPFNHLAVLNGWVRRPVLRGLTLEVPTETAVDRKLVLGGAVFGAGYGLSGLSPGSALVLVGSPYGPPLVFLAAMFAGFITADSSTLNTWIKKVPAPAIKESTQ